MLAGEGLTRADTNGDTILDVADAIALARVISRPPVGIVESSPSPGEGNVAVTRETIIRFDGAVDPATVTGASVRARFGGQALPVRLHVAPDRRSLTLFYQVPLPGSARIRVQIDGGLLLEAERGWGIDADGDGREGGIGVIDFDTLSLTRVPHTFVYGRVFASELATAAAPSTDSLNMPLAGVVITVDGLETTVRATTDQFGNFRLENPPGGRFFVHIDGRAVKTAFVDGQAVPTSYPDGFYYPFVGKKFQSVPGQEINMGNVYLPLVYPGTLQPVSETEDTTITFAPGVLERNPELAGVTVTVPADSLFADDGTRGGMVGIAPVPPDRIPGPLPPELNFPIVITVQTDGPTNFDRPIAACFPNVPHPVTGETLPTGSKSALFSFNHDTGRFEMVGPMTVSDDGRLVCTDPGIGIPAPGWHGTQPGTSGSGGPLEGSDGSGSGDGGGASDRRRPRPKPRPTPPPPTPTPRPPPMSDCSVEIAMPLQGIRHPETKPLEFRAIGMPMPGQMVWFLGSGNTWARPDGFDGESGNVQFFNDVTRLDSSLLRVKWEPDKGGLTCYDDRTVTIIPSSKAAWVFEYPGSDETRDLSEPFATNVDRFFHALFIAAVDYPFSNLRWTFTSTFRPAKRAYLMHFASKISSLLIDAESVPPFDPATVSADDPFKGSLDINWVHYKANGEQDLLTTVMAAYAMESAYGIVYPPALQSRHTQGLAIDVKILWDDDFSIKLPDGSLMPIPKNPGNGAQSTALHAAGATFGVIKLGSDPPHWSSDGH